MILVDIESHGRYRIPGGQEVNVYLGRREDTREGRFFYLFQGRKHFLNAGELGTRMGD